MTEPPFRFTRESKIRIDRDGHVWHEGDRVEHGGLERALASWIALDAETGRYVLRNALDWCFVTVDDAPVVVRNVSVDPSGRAALELSDGTTETLDPATLRVDADDVPYCTVHARTLPARFSRSAAFALLAHADEQGEWLEIPSGRFAIGRVTRGAGAAPYPALPLVSFFTRARCGLCDAMESVIEQVHLDRPVVLERIDVDTMPDLRARYGGEVPVVCINGRKAFKYRMTAEAFRSKLARAAGDPPGTTASLEDAVEVGRA